MSARFITATTEPKPSRHTAFTSDRTRELVGARCYGENVILLVNGEIEQEHTGHLRLE